MSETSSALVLLSTILFRRALRSPGSGGRPFSIGFFLFFTNVVCWPRAGGPALLIPGFLTFGAGLERFVLVVKAALHWGI